MREPANDSEHRPLPSALLPAALVRWLGPDAPISPPMAADPGAGIRLDEDLWAFLPAPCRPDPFARAAGWATREARTDRAKFPGALIFPGWVEAKRHQFQAEASPLLIRQALPTARAVLGTGYVAAWLGGHYDTDAAGRWELGRGKSIPLAQLTCRPSPRQPFRNADVLGRRIDLERPEISAVIQDYLEHQGAVRLTGGLGVGKTHLAWKMTQGAETAWLDLSHGCPGPRLLRVCLAALEPTHPKAPAPADATPADAERQAARLLDALAGRQAPLTVVIDHATWLDPLDLEILSLVLPVATADRLARFLVIEPGGCSAPAFRHLPTVVVERWAAPQMDDFADRLFARLEIPTPLRDHWLEMANGCPWALEECLLAQVHQGVMRRVFGSFFYAGTGECEFRPSLRWSATVAAALPTPELRLAAQLLAVAEEPIQASHLIEAAVPFGVDLPWGFEEPLLDADLWQVAPGGGLQFVLPAAAKAVAEGLRRDGVASLRHALGGVLAESGATSGLSAYRMLAGSREALPTLLDYGRESTDHGSRAEVFNALFAEYRDHRDRFGDIATELEILWVLLPLARRLGCLVRLERELDRAIELAADDSHRLVALIALRAEHDQDRGRSREAERGFRTALAASEGLDEHRRAVLFTRLGALLHRQERTGEAREIFERLLEVVDREAPSALGATCQFYLANIALAEQRFADAAQLHHRAAATRRARGLIGALGTSLSAQGTVALALGDYSGAFRFAEEAQQLMLASHADPEELSYALLCRGRALSRRGDLTAGLRDFRRVVELRQGRDDIAGESIARLELAEALLHLGQATNALEQARRAHFFLSLGGRSSLLGDAERAMARILLHQGQFAEAATHAAEALAIHLRQQDRRAVLFDRALALQIALAQARKDEALLQTTALERALAHETNLSLDAEYLDFWLFRGLSWLETQGSLGSDPMIYLRRAYQELLRKANFLETQERHGFLFQIADHRMIVEAATDLELSLPILTVPTESG